MIFRDIKVVFWDIYGTILKTFSGDVNSFTEKVLLKAFSKVILKFEINDEPKKLFNKYIESIKNEHVKKISTGISHPEIDIVDVWKNILMGTSDKLDDNFVKEVAFHFHTITNKPKIYPGVYRTLKKIKSRFNQGIISNSQFYTIPELIDHLRKQGPIESIEELFDIDSIILSYKMGFSKPNPQIFIFAAKKAACEMEQTVYVGNDIYNDIYIPKSLGMKTILYAGDPETVRWQKDNPECQKVKPDRIIKSIPQILNYLF